MAKQYQDRAMKVETDREFVFPKEGKVIKAKTRAEAEKKLVANEKQEND